jgi:hypothetical protein
MLLRKFGICFFGNLDYTPCLHSLASHLSWSGGRGRQRQFREWSGKDGILSSFWEPGRFGTSAIDVCLMERPQPFSNPDAD